MARVSLLSGVNKRIAAAFSDTVLLFDDDSSPKEPLLLKPEVTKSDGGGNNEELIDLKINSMCFNKDHTILVVIYSNKNVSCWNCSDGKLLATTKLPKKLASCYVASLPKNHSKNAGNDNDEVVLVGDKTGDVYALSFPLLENKKLMLGHTASIITSMAIIPPSGSSSHSMLATADRDEKIRISYFPQTSLIHSFCLGHLEYVTSLSFLEVNKPLLSISGDSTLKVWNVQKEKEGDINNKDSVCIGTWSSGKGVPISMTRSLDHDMVVIALANQTFLTFIDLSNIDMNNNSNDLKVLYELEIHNKPVNMCFYGKNQLLVQIDQAPYLQVYEKNDKDNRFVLNTTSSLPSRVSSLVEANGLKVMSALSLDDHELCDSNVSAEPIEQEDGNSFVAGASELRKRVVSRPCQDWNSKKRLTVQSGGRSSKRTTNTENNAAAAEDE